MDLAADDDEASDSPPVQLVEEDTGDEEARGDPADAAGPTFGGLLRADLDEDVAGPQPALHGQLQRAEKQEPRAAGGKWKKFELGKKGARLRAGLATEILSEIEEEVRAQQAAQAVARRSVEWEDSLDAVLEPVLAIPGAPSAGLLVLALLATVLLADAHAWRFIRRPLPFNFLLTPFLTAAALAGVLGFLALPVLRKLKARQVGTPPPRLRKLVEGGQRHVLRTHCALSVVASLVRSRPGCPSDRLTACLLLGLSSQRRFVRGPNTGSPIYARLSAGDPAGGASWALQEGGHPHHGRPVLCSGGGGGGVHPGLEQQRRPGGLCGRGAVWRHWAAGRRAQGGAGPQRRPARPPQARPADCGRLGPRHPAAHQGARTIRSVREQAQRQPSPQRLFASTVG